MTWLPKPSHTISTSFFKVTVWFPKWRSLKPWKGHLWVQTRSLEEPRAWNLYINIYHVFYIYYKRTVWLYLGVLHLGSGCPKMPRRMQVVFCSAMQVGRKIYPPNTWHAVSLKNHLTNIEKTHEYKLISKQMHLWVTFFFPKDLAI